MLPSEIWLRVFDYLEIDDIMAVHQVCKQFFTLSDPLVFAHMWIEWDELPHVLGSVTSRWVQKMVISEASAVSEWRLGPSLKGLANKARHWTHFSVQCANSSGWLQYTGVLPITHLSLTNCARGVRYFDFDHILKVIPKLQSIELDGFILRAPAEPLSHLTEATLIDCKWTYPTNLADIGPLETLKIRLTPIADSFSFSERLQHDSNELPSHLKVLHIHLDVDHTVNWKPLQSGAPNLEELSLRGFQPFEVKNRKDLPMLALLEQGPSLL